MCLWSDAGRLGGSGGLGWLSVVSRAGGQLARSWSGQALSGMTYLCSRNEQAAQTVLVALAGFQRGSSSGRAPETLTRTGSVPSALFRWSQQVQGGALTPGVMKQVPLLGGRNCNICVWRMWRQRWGENEVIFIIFFVCLLVCFYHVAYRDCSEHSVTSDRKCLIY